VTKGVVHPQIRASVLAWIGCIAGALDADEYRAKLATAGFENIAIEPTRVYKAEDAQVFLAEQGIDITAIGDEIDGKFTSAFIRAVKPDRQLA
jgi:arsenite methyltransferase